MRNLASSSARCLTGAAGAAMLALWASHPVHAVEALPGTQLKLNCTEYLRNPASVRGVACLSYIHGFLGGAHVTSPENPPEKNPPENDKSQSAAPSQRSAFVRRAIRTRATRFPANYGRYYTAGYCVPAQELIASVVSKITRYMTDNPSVIREPAATIVLQGLMVAYPCPPPPDSENER